MPPPSDAAVPPVGGPEPAGAPAAVSSRAWWTAVVYIAAAALFLRFYDLPLKPLHHDEGVNTLFLTALAEPPHAFRYDPANYHGPTLYYFGWLSVLLFDLTTVAARGVTAVAGLLTVLVVLALRRELGAVGALAAAGLLALSPGAVYFSRYFIHESLLVAFSAAAVVSGAAWWRSGRGLPLVLAAASAGAMFATKETAAIVAVVWIGALAGATLLCARREPAAQWNDRAPHRSPAMPAAWRAAGARLASRRGLLSLSLALAVFLAVNLLFYTSFFTNGQGAIDAVRTFAFWTRTGATAHTRPWHAYLAWLAAEELPLLLAGGAGAAWALWRSENRFAVFAGLWALGVLTAYSVIPYKTPWLILNVIAPLAICGGHLAQAIWRRRRRLPRGLPAAAAVALAAAAAWQSVALNFVRYDDNRRPYVYAHTSREVLELVRVIDRIEAQHPRAAIAVTSPDHFPLSWYLRAYPTGFYGRPVVTGDPLVIAAEEQQPALESLLESHDRSGSYSLRPGVQLVLYVRRDLRRPAPDPGADADRDGR